MATVGGARSTAHNGRSVRSPAPARRSELLNETDCYLAELIEEVGEPSPEEVAEAEAWCDRIERHLKEGARHLMRAVVLDSGAVTRLASRDRLSAARIGSLQRSRQWTPL